MIARLPNDRKVINATEGGAKIHGTVQMTLADVIESLPERKVDFQTILEDERTKITEREYKGIMRDFSHFRPELEKIKKQGYYKTFFQTDFKNNPVMDIVIGYMRYLKDVKDRKERFRLAVDYVYEEVRKREAGETCVQMN
jgi:hypothetical protein